MYKKISFNTKKYEVKQFVENIFPDFFIPLEIKVSWWHRLFRTKKYLNAKKHNYVVFYEEMKIQLENNINVLGDTNDKRRKTKNK